MGHANAFDNIGQAAAHQDRGPLTLAVINILAVLAAILIFLRLLSRRLSRTKLWLDDYLILYAFCICCTCVGLAVRAVHHGTGQHMHHGSGGHHRHREALKVLWASQFLYTWCLAATKLSIIFQLWRIFNIMDRFRLAAYALSGLVVLWAIACSIVALLECKPINAFWLDPGSDKCMSAEHYLMANGVPNTVTDFLLILTPLPFIFRLGFIRLWQRLGIIFTFALGGLVTIVSIFRLVVVRHHKSSADITWSFTSIIIWSAVEYSVGIICACIPALAPLVRMTLRKVYRNSSVSSLRRNVSDGFSSATKAKTRLQKPLPVAKRVSEERLNEIWIGDEQVLLCARSYDDAEKGMPMEVVLTKHALS